MGVALSGCAVIAFGTLYLAHGVSDRTTVALLGTLASLALTAILATGFAAAAQLSGLASEESLTLLAFAPDLDFRGLLLAAVILGALGVLDDVTITQVSAVWELRRTDPTLSRRQLYAAGIRIGRDHIASTVNTLVLAYSAAALPLLLIYTQSGLGFGGVLATETVAVEIVQTLVGSIGLVASVPLTTALACRVITRPAGPAAPDRGGAHAGPGEDERAVVGSGRLGPAARRRRAARAARHRRRRQCAPTAGPAGGRTTTSSGPTTPGDGPAERAHPGRRSPPTRVAASDGISDGMVRWPCSGQIRRLAVGITSAVWRAWATGTMSSASPWSTDTGTLMAPGSNVHARACRVASSA